MRLFLGEYQPNITEGSRLALPKNLRDQVPGDKVILSKGFEKCIFGYAREDWEEEVFKQADTPISDARARRLKRYMFSGAAEVNLDGQGRFVIPAHLREYADIQSSLVLIGTGDHFEIWDESLWKAHLKEIEEEAAQENYA